MANKIPLLLVVVLYIVVVLMVASFPQPAQAAGGGCPKLVPVPIDENFLFKKQPEDGFHAAFASGQDSMPKYTAKPVPSKGVAGRKSICVKAKLVVSGKEMMSIPPMMCSYARTPSHVYCDMSKAGGGAASAMAATGIQIPKASLGYVVDTDNSTYLAYATCMDGAIYQWVIYSIEPKLKKVRARTLKALSIDKKGLEATANIKFKAGTTQITKGACTGGGGVAGKIGEGLGNLFDG